MQGQRKSNYCWLIVTADDYELPLCVRDYARELAEELEISEKTITSAFSQQSISKIKFNGHRFKIVRIEWAKE